MKEDNQHYPCLLQEKFHNKLRWPIRAAFLIHGTKINNPVLETSKIMIIVVRQVFANYPVAILCCCIMPIEILWSRKRTAYGDNINSGFILLLSYTTFSVTADLCVGLVILWKRHWSLTIIKLSVYDFKAEDKNYW